MSLNPNGKWHQGTQDSGHIGASHLQGLIKPCHLPTSLPRPHPSSTALPEVSSIPTLALSPLPCPLPQSLFSHVGWGWWSGQRLSLHRR